jgi:hypothetical protein
VYREPGGQGLRYLSGQVDRSGRIVGRRFWLNQGTARPAYEPAVATGGDGRLVVAYRGDRAGDLWCLSGTFDPSGRVDGVTFPLTGDGACRGYHPTVAFDHDGKVIILWQAPDDEGLCYVHGPVASAPPFGEVRSLTIGMERR